jgi:hypothetical protein
MPFAVKQCGQIGQIKRNKCARRYSGRFEPIRGFGAFLGQGNERSVMGPSAFLCDLFLDDGPTKGYNTVGRAALETEVSAA